jgi:hypothetical protein
MVDSTITRAPFLSTGPTDSHADLRALKRGRWSASTGVSTQISTMSAFDSALCAVLACRCLESMTLVRSAASPGSSPSIGDSPELIISTRLASMSTPVTLKPASAITHAAGSPT